MTGSLEVDPIINKISGRTKRLKRYIQVEKKEGYIIFIEEHFKDYFTNNLNIPSGLIGRFINYLIENKKVQFLIESKRLGELTFNQ